MEQQSKDLDMLDLAVLVVERAKLLCGATLLGAALAVGGGMLLPREYVSEAVISLPTPFSGGDMPIPVSHLNPAEAAKIMLSPLVLDVVILKDGLEAKSPIENARKQLMATLKVTSAQDQLLFLKVTEDSPEKARKRANAVLDAWFVAVQPSEQQKKDLENYYEQTNASLAVANRLVERLVVEQLAHSRKVGEQDRGGMSLAMALETQSLLRRQVSFLSSVMRGLTRDVVKQEPTLPSTPEAAAIGLLGLLGALLGGGLALLWVVLIDAWRRSSENPAFAERLSRLRSAGRRN